MTDCTVTELTIAMTRIIPISVQKDLLHIPGGQLDIFIPNRSTITIASTLGKPETTMMRIR